MRAFFLLLLAIPTLAWASAPAGMKPVGSATLSKLIFTVYDATLYAPAGTFDAAKPHALEITYRMDFSSDEIIDRSLDEIKRAQKVSAAEEKRWRAALAKAIPDVKEGDRIRATATPSAKLVFTHNERATATIRDATLVAPFMNIWLGKSTSEPELRRKLIGKK